MTEPALRGVFAPVLTPFGADLAPDPDRLVALCRRLLDDGVGLAPFGTTSEANSLGVDERMDLLDALIDAGLDAARLMPGTGTCAITDTVRLTAHAVARGCAGVLMLPPFYYKAVSDDGLYAAFAETIERVGDARLRICLYHIPPVSQVPVTLALIERLVTAYPDTVVGIKDSSGDWNNTAAVLDAFPQLAVFPGSETFLLHGLRHGGAGCISATANVNPAAIRALHDNWQTPDAAARQADLDRVRAAFQRRPMIPALKAMTARLAGDPDWRRVRPPLVELDRDDELALAAELEGLGFAAGALAAV